MAAGLMDRVPPQARRHLIAEQRLSRWRTASMVWTMERVATMLGDAPYPRVLLKGAAYIGQGLPIAAGRLPSDLDILVPQAHLPDAQARLIQAGWNAVELDEHDRRYYYEWSHEVPPMTHPLLAMELDLHHNILPPVARTHVDADTLLQRLQPFKVDVVAGAGSGRPGLAQRCPPVPRLRIARPHSRPRGSGRSAQAFRRHAGLLGPTARARAGVGA